jgi:hypothetical protein
LDWANIIRPIDGNSGKDVRIVILKFGAFPRFRVILLTDLIRIVLKIFSKTAREQRWEKENQQQ